MLRERKNTPLKNQVADEFASAPALLPTFLDAPGIQRDFHRRSWAAASAFGLAAVHFGRQECPWYGLPAKGSGPGRFFGIRKIQRLAMLAAIDLGVLAPFLLDFFAEEIPPLQVSCAEFAFFVLLVAGAHARDATQKAN